MFSHEFRLFSHGLFCLSAMRANLILNNQRHAAASSFIFQHSFVILWIFSSLLSYENYVHIFLKLCAFISRSSFRFGFVLIFFHLRSFNIAVGIYPPSPSILPAIFFFFRNGKNTRESWFSINFYLNMSYMWRWRAKVVEIKWIDLFVLRFITLMRSFAVAASKRSQIVGTHFDFFPSISL